MNWKDYLVGTVIVSALYLINEFLRRFKTDIASVGVGLMALAFMLFISIYFVGCVGHLVLNGKMP